MVSEGVVGAGDPRAHTRPSVHAVREIVVAIREYDVAAATTKKRVVAYATEQRVIVARTDQQVVTGITREHVNTAACGRLCFSSGDGIRQRQLSAAVDAVIASAAAQEGLTSHAGCAADDDVVALCSAHEGRRRTVGVGHPPVRG